MAHRRGAQSGNQNRAGRFRKYGEALVSTIRDMTDRGYSVREIAVAVSGDSNGHLSRSTINRVQRLFGMTKRTGGPRVSITPVIALERKKGR
jgi:hypothetical protein